MGENGRTYRPGSTPVSQEQGSDSILGTDSFNMDR